MAKPELKTKPSEVSANDFIAALPDARRREEAEVIDAIHRRVTGLEPKMWGPSRESTNGCTGVLLAIECCAVIILIGSDSSQKLWKRGLN